MSKGSPPVNRSIDDSYMFFERAAAARRQPAKHTPPGGPLPDKSALQNIQDLARNRRRPTEALRSRFYSRDRIVKDSKRSTPTQQKCSPIPGAAPQSSLPQKYGATHKYEALEREEKVNNTVVNSRESSSIIQRQGGTPLLPALEPSSSHQQPPGREHASAVLEDVEGLRSPSRFSNNNNNSYIEVNNSVIIVSNASGGAYKQGGAPAAPGGARIGRRVKNAAAKRDMKCVCLAKEAGTKSAQTHVPVPVEEERKSNVLKSYLDASIYTGNAPPPEKGASEKTVKPGKRAGPVPGAASANTSFECYSSPSN